MDRTGTHARGYPRPEEPRSIPTRADDERPIGRFFSTREAATRAPVSSYAAPAFAGRGTALALRTHR